MGLQFCFHLRNFLTKTMFTLFLSLKFELVKIYINEFSLINIEFAHDSQILISWIYL
jgi:hypothetical protein